jgi:DNA-binding NtrC family response regulator/predicted TIM-barrel enzyme
MAALFHQRPDGVPMIAVVAGSGQIARYAVSGGADLLIVLNAGLYRTLGTGSLASFLPYGNANEQTEQLLRQHVLPRAGGTPVIAGAFGADPTTDLPAYLKRLKELGVAGVTNWPSLGFVDGQFREAVEEDSFNIESEQRTLRAARAAGLAAVGFVHNAADAAQLAPLSDAMILNLGLTRYVEDIQNRRDRLQYAIAGLNTLLSAIERTGHRPPCLAFGGPITSAEEWQLVARQSRVDGFAGGSVFERLPVHRIVESTVRGFKAVRLGGTQERIPDRFGSLVGRSRVMQQLFDTIQRVAPYDVNVCIEGESGTGKELVATQIHRFSPRSEAPLVTLNCGAIPEALIESELFGHEKGAFTGADRRRLGKFELAHGGTLLLDEVADLSPHAQVALLRAIQQGEVVPVGAERPVQVNVRILAASHQNLQQCVADKRFRADLYYRLNQLTIRVPSVAERRDDIPLLVDGVLVRLRAQLGKELTGVSADFTARLKSHAWPGNVRELEHVICRAALLEDGPVLKGRSFVPEEVRADVAHFAADRAAGRNPANLRRLATEALQQAGGNKSKAAATLGVSRKTLYSWLASDE